MATRTIANAGGTWSVAGTWVEGVVPTAADDVVATATSGNLTLAGNGFCRSIDLSLYASGKVFTHGSGQDLVIGDASGGALNFSGAWTYTNNAGVIKFNSTSTNGGAGWPVTPGGRTFHNTTFQGVGGKWVLQGTLTCRHTDSTTLIHSGGHLDTNNQAINARTFNSSGSNVRTLTLGSSVITLTRTTAASSWDTTTVTNLTVTANTATVVIDSANNGGTFTSGTQDWNGLSLSMTGIGAGYTLTGAVTLRNLTRTVGTGSNHFLNVASNFTITGVLTVAGFNSTTQRLTIRSSSAGTPRTITLNGSLVETDTDYTADIVKAGAGWSPPPAGGKVKTSAGVTKPTKIFPGGVEKPVKLYTGSTWELV